MFCSRPHQVMCKNRNTRDRAGTRRHSATGFLSPGLFAVVAGFLALPSVAGAQQWLFTPEIEIGAHYVDNPRLEESGDTDSITGGLLDVAGALRRNSETSSVLFRPAAAIYRYSGDTNEDSEAYFLDFNANKQGQKSNWRFRGNFRQQQVYQGETTSAEFDDIGVDDSVQTGSGRIFERRQRDMWRLRPGVTFDLTQRTALEFDVNYLDVQYDSQELGEAVDYTNSRADAAIVRALSEDSDLTFGVFASRYEPDEQRRETDSTGVRVRYGKQVSNISSFFIEVGAQDSNIQSAVDPQDETSESSFLWNIGYDRQLEVTHWRFDIGQAVTPSGSGFMVERDLYRVIMRRQLQPRWALELSAVAMNTDTLGDDALTVNDRDYLQGQASLEFQMTRSWAVEGLYGYTYQDFTDITGDAQEHEFRLSLVYQPPIPTQTIPTQ